MSFHTTRWSLILAARDPAVGAAAFAELCRSYRAPVLAYVRWLQPAQAEDLTQAFFLKLLEKRYDLAADPARGRFRSFLLAALKGFLANAADAAATLRRGGSVDHEPIEALADRADGLGPERAFDRVFALEVIGRALAHLRDQCEAAGQAERYAALAPWLIEAPDAGAYRALAAQLGLPANTVAVQVKRLRERLQAGIRAELLDTLSDPRQLGAELSALKAALSGDR